MSPSDSATGAPSLVGSAAGRVGWRARLGIAAAVATLAVVLFLLMRTGADDVLRWDFTFGLSFERRLRTVCAMVIAAFCQGIATVLFHTVTHNRILTPSIIGLDSLYVLIQTVGVFLVGGSFVENSDSVPQFLAQTGAMVLFASILYRWLFSGRFASLFLLLLAGVVLGLAFRAVAEFLQRLLSPTEFDALSIKLFGRLGSVNADLLPITAIACLLVAVYVWRRRTVYDVLLLGRDPAIALGVDHRAELTRALMLIALLISISTALVGPMVFFGFIIATLAYEAAGDWRHRATLPMAFLLGVITLAAGQYILQNLFYAAGMLTVIIEFCGGILFLAILFRRRGTM
ncbi:Transport system permease protein OS=Tsukamurella paurometabola (strain ATCC 8368 / DSM / CCUG 35730 / CIP 100753 / JCM 10117 / KCTC 9821 / NBRC 16120 /NCIMB 702349 / NCTC 13040) OX=521096 GN=Tpau_2665 PE=3 SV=1 [Tsukamurella paurometabola]|uniref:Transport system permease protein n=1 Tax=Tsukamurella paurometabola (strain ATCC 8368 / DSM 20162 / CCUG 35730 / CIP 100753 / JCM 10117 / KCTC 9821 / NBRC 16120 / NCIMB 702349 / NCTC 13040) TaxID=521096 RepID=D5USJ4_TSUPD|nr:iron chelate uptake ABC transporter family permease subunit [Tsukamurella paurometabola]ADG79265.1 transport system permease protein [Tsukamurella paurometabola DSM 20162]SUP34831.1 Iron-uptake system permease protein FeuC [Tsukamurella paurometabola]